MPPRNAKIKLQDIARLTGHTIGTVSKALHDQPGISEKTRARILEVARESGYIGNAMAGNMKMSMTGALAVEMISRISTTKCILGVSGISAEGGLTSMAVQDPAVNRAMIQHCNGPVIIAADHRKVGIRHNFLFGSLSDVSRLVTDTGSDPEELENIRRAGVEITLVDPDK
mgnify:CR=1 FL=1